MVLEYCPLDRVLIDRDMGQVINPMIAFIGGGMTLPMDTITRDYLINHRLTPYKCAPNLFRVLGCVDVVHMYECHKLTGVGYYLKSRSEEIKLISYLPKSNKGMKDDYLIVLGEWKDGLHCPTRARDLSVVPLGSVPLEEDLAF